MCQGCVEDGSITAKVLAVIDDFAEKWPSSPYGPAHMVIDDTNVDDASIRWVLDHWAENEEDDPSRADEYAATKSVLAELLDWPIEDRVGFDR